MWVKVGTLRSKLQAAEPAERAWLQGYLSYEERGYGGKKVTRCHLDIMSNTFPSGFLGNILSAARAEGVLVQLVDARVPPVALDPTADLAWLRDYQRAAVDAVTKHKRGILWLPTGCLAGDTRLLINRGGAVRPVSLETVVRRLAGEATKNRAGKSCAWDLAIPTFTQSVDAEGFVRKNRIERGWSNGRAEVFEVVTAGGRVLRATAQHRFLTPGRFARLHELCAGDPIMATVWPAALVGNRRKPSYEQQPHMWNHPFAQITNSSRDGRIARYPTHRLVAEAKHNQLTLAEFIGRIVLNETEGLTFLDPALWHVHHRDNDARNNHPDNLEILSPAEHLRKHGAESGWKHVAGRAVPERIRSITRVGEEEVFDLEMAEPMHNYVANELVVHNSGKTEIAVGLTRAFPCQWLALVHRGQLADDIASRWEKRTEGAGAGRIVDGKWDVPRDARLVAATFQSIVSGLRRAKHGPNDEVYVRTKALLAGVEGLIVDECHTLPADTFYHVAMSTPRAYYRVGLSGTPLARGDRKSRMAVAALGGVIYRIRSTLLIDRGVLAKPTVRLATVTQASNRPTWPGVYGELVARSKVRNAAVVELVRRATKPGFVFVNQIDHGKALTKLLMQNGVNAEFVWGDHSIDWRKSHIRRLEQGHFDVLVCSAVFQEGVDVPALRSVVVASGGMSAIATLQRLGRGMRVDRKADGTAHEGGDVFEVWDVLDKGNKWTEKHGKARLAAYTSEGYATFVEPSAVSGLRAGTG